MNGVGVANNGISFGWGGGLIHPIVFLGLCLLLLYLLLAKKLSGWGWWLIFLGGLLNSWSRFFNGYVWDYWRLPFLGLWFNGADLLIVLGVIWQILI